MFELSLNVCNVEFISLGQRFMVCGENVDRLICFLKVMLLMVDFNQNHFCFLFTGKTHNSWQNADGLETFFLNFPPAVKIGDLKTSVITEIIVHTYQITPKTIVW